MLSTFHHLHSNFFSLLTVSPVLFVSSRRHAHLVDTARALVVGRPLGPQSRSGSTRHRNHTSVVLLVVWAPNCLDNGRRNGPRPRSWPATSHTAQYCIPDCFPRPSRPFRLGQLDRRCTHRLLYEFLLSLIQFCFRC